ncbi:hypothetical protein HZA75_02515 [Candidatus Roizmanbacteria bacterium]|nr:hypothetical protein [Candidatus Roizmanbacteria bacterium]
MSDEAPLEERRTDAAGKVIEPIGPSTKLPPHVGNIEGLLVFLSLFGGKTLRTFARLKSKGVEIAPISHEFDVIQPIDPILKLFGLDERSEITVGEQRGHQDIVLQPELSAHVFRRS